MLELFNIVGIIIKCPSAGGHFVIIKGSIMLHSGKVCTTDGERTVPGLWRLPQLKRGVEHDYHIYTWNSACTMEGIDMAMVWNSLLNDTSGGLNCAGCCYLQNGGGHLGVHCGCYLQTVSRERTDRDWNHCGCLAAGGRAHSDAMMQPGVCDAGDVRGGGLGCT